MHSVCLNARGQNQDFQEFEESMLQICKEHQTTRRALAFAFILYDFNNAHVAKILKDPDYWQSLHQISGNYLTVFSCIVAGAFDPSVATNFDPPQVSFFYHISVSL